VGRRALLLVGGPHPFDETTPVVEKIVGDAGFASETFDDIEAGLRELRKGAHALLVVHCLRWSMTQSPKYAPVRDRWGFELSDAGKAIITDHLQRGGGLLGLHAASISFDRWPGWRDLLGAAWIWNQSSHPPLGPLGVSTLDAVHPVTRGVAPFDCDDELYSNLDTARGVVPLAYARQSSGGELQPVVLASEPLRGRAVYIALGHGRATFEVPSYAQLVRQAAQWCVSRNEADSPVAQV
jgi:type 1 glutamine amidotransferase